MQFITSDHHFDHTNIISYCKRPFKTIKDMNNVMIARWNTVVKPTDTVYHLGDFALAGRKRIAELQSKLNGKIVLIRGNHDGSVRTMEQCGFAVIHSKYLELDKIIFSHQPLTNEETHGKINFHGHIHDILNKDRHHINVCVEQTNYYPIPLHQAFRLPMKCDNCGGLAPRNNPVDLCNKCLEEYNAKNKNQDEMSKLQSPVVSR